MAQTAALSLDSGTGTPGGTLTLNVTLSSGGGAQPAAVQWTLAYPVTSVATVSAVAGPAASAASKSLACGSSSGSYTCIVSGMNAGSIGDGVVASITLTLTSTASTASLALTNTTAVFMDGTALPLTGTGGTVIVNAPPPGTTISSLTCSPTSLGPGGTASCAIALSGAAPAGGVTVSLGETGSISTGSSGVTIAAGSAGGTFTITAGQFTASQSATVTASLNGASQTASLSLAAPAAALSLACAPGIVVTGGSTSCSINLQGPAPSGGTLVTLSDNSQLISTPASVTVAAGATSATFMVTSAGASPIFQAVAITAAGNGTSVSYGLSVVPAPPTFSILGNPSEVNGSANGSTVTPTAGPTGLTGALVANGTGTVNFSSTPAGNGVYFENCCSNSNNSYYKFTGASIGNIFNFSQGQIGFALTSRANLAQRTLYTSYRSVLDVRDANPANHLIYFNTQVSSGSLVFYYSVNGQNAYYFVPKGTEDALFGNGVTMQVTMSWSGSTLTLYLNGNPVNHSTYAAPTPNWTSASVLDIGAYEFQTYGGYDSCDDVISNLTITGVPPAVSSLQCTPAAVIGGSSSTCTATLTSAPSMAVAVTLSANSPAVAVPATVTVPGGSVSASFPAATVPVAVGQTSVISASFGGTSQTASLAVAAPTLTLLQCTPASMPAGASAVCTVTLSGSAPASGAVVALSSNNAALTVPASVTVAAGAVSAAFTAATAPVSSNQTGAITASYNGSTQTASLAITALVMTSLQCTPASVIGGGSSTCTVSLSGSAPASGAVVGLSSNNAALTVPASVTVAAGAVSAAFTAATAPVSSNQTGAITASYNGSTQTAPVAITAMLVTSLQCTPASIIGGASTTCTVALSNSAPAGGAVVTLSSNNAALTAPNTVTVAAGASSATFTAATTAVSSNQTGGITASYNGSTQTASLAITAASPSSVQCTPGTVTGGSASTCTVMLCGNAPSAGTVVTLSSTNPAVTVPASITIPGGSISATFAASTNPMPANTSVTLGASYFGISQTAGLMVLAPAPQSLTCSPTIVASGSNTSCTVTLSGPSPAAGLVVAVSSNNPNLTVPAGLSVPAGSASATFVANAMAITSDQAASITASANGGVQSATVSLSAPAILTSLACNPASVASGKTAACTISLNKAAPAAGATVALAGGTAALAIPASVTIPAGSISGTFSATASGTTNQTVPLTASWNGVTVSFTATVLPPPPTLSILGNASELSGTRGGALLTPTIAPAGLTGALVANGTGAVNFAPDASGNGVYFQNCCANNNNSYYKFTGAAVGQIFNFTQGQISFTLTSRANLAQRAQYTSYRSVLDVRDGNAANHLVYFTTQVSSGALVFYYAVNGVNQFYFVPAGTENTLFGSGVAMQVTITWSGSTMKLYLNGTLVKSSSYTAPTPNWTSASVFDLGAYEYLTYGGYDSCDDVISDFSVGPLIQP